MAPTSRPSRIDTSGRPAVRQMRPARPRGADAAGAAGEVMRRPRRRPPPRPAVGSPPPVAISRPTSFLSAVRPSTVATIPPAVHDGDPVGQLEDLVELGRHEQDRRPVVAHRMRLPVDELDAADVEAARRLVEDEQLQLPIELARDDQLLLVPARQRARRRRSGDGVRTSYFGDALGGRLGDGREVAQDPARERRTVVAGQDDVVGAARTAGPGRTGGGRPARRRRPPRSSRAGRSPVTSSPASATRPPATLRSPMIASTSSSWPLPATPAIPRISPARTSRSTPRTTLDCPGRRTTWRPVTSSDRAGRMRLAAVDRQLDLASDHQLGEVVLVRLGRDPLADDLAPPDDRDPVGDLEDLVELVADEDDAVALGGEAAQDREDLLGLLGRQDRGRLVEDEDPRIAIERLEDLDPLLPADRQRADLGVGIDLEAEALAELDDPPARPPCGRGRSGWPSSPRRAGCSRRR